MRADDEALTVLARELAAGFGEAGCMLATAESCTGGWIAKCLTDVAGSSRWFAGGIVSYSNAAKMHLLGVPAAMIETHGAVSEPVARAMAEGALQALAADCAVAVTGVAGPGGGTAAKPVGTVWFAWAVRGQPTRAEMQRFDGDRERVRRESVRRALEGVSASMQNPPPTPPSGLRSQEGGQDVFPPSLAKGDQGGCLPAERTRRLFFALWPGRATRTAIRHAAKEAIRHAGGRPVPAENYHLTLAFLGAQPESRLPAIREAAAGIAPPAGEMCLDRLGAFRRAGVLWLGPARTPPGLRAFAGALGEALAPLGIARERRRFAAHLTLARKIQHVPEMAIKPVEWRYSGFALLESITDPRGVRYKILARWPAVK